MSSHYIMALRVCLYRHYIEISTSWKFFTQLNVQSNACVHYIGIDVTTTTSNRYGKKKKKEVKLVLELF